MKKFIVILLVMLNLSLIWAAENATAEDVRSVKIEADSIVATFVIPQDMHLTIQKDYFYLDVDPIEGITFEETIYPKGKMDDYGFENVYGTVQLIKKFTIDDKVDREKVEFKIYAGFQLCYDSYCEAPVDAEYTLPLIPQNN